MIQKKKKKDFTILIVDDIPENLELFNDVLIDEGYKVLTADSGVSALEVVQTHKVDLIVADALMPKMDGLELCKQIRSLESFRTVPFIIYTGNYVDTEDQELARNIGVNRYVMKTSGLTELVKAIEEELENSKATTTADISVPTIDEQSFLEKHHSIVTKKLEEKMKELELYAETLTQRNRQLIISESRYRTLFEQAVVGIMLLNKGEKRIVDVNRECERIYRDTGESLLQENTARLYSPKGELLNIFEFEGSITSDAILKRKDGTEAYIELNAGPILHAVDEDLYIIFLRDVTEQKRMREQILQTERMSTMGRIAAGIAHEIRNPLAGISLNLQFLDRRLQPGTPEHDSVLAALEGVTRIQQVIEDTLGLARVKPPTFNKEDIHPLLEKTLVYLKLVFRQKGLVIQKHYAQSLPQVLIDSNQIQQVFLNILQNAADASPEGGSIIISTEEATRKEHPDKKYVKITIRDYGCGFSPQILEHIFEPFYTTKSDGTGLGMMLSKYIIDRHQGFIEIKNADGGGAEVSIYLLQ